MRLPDQLADVASALARQGRTSDDPSSYADGVRDTLVFVGEMMQLAASTLPTSATELDRLHEHPTPTATRLRHLASQLHVLITQGPEDEDMATPSGQSVAFVDLLRAHALLVRAASVFDPHGAAAAPPPAPTTPAVPTGAQANSTWLAAFVLAVVGQRDVDEQDVVDLLRLADYDIDVLDAARERVEHTDGIDDAVRREGRALLWRAATAADDLRPATQGSDG